MPDEHENGTPARHRGTPGPRPQRKWNRRHNRARYCPIGKREAGENAGSPPLADRGAGFVNVHHQSAGAIGRLLLSQERHQRSSKSRKHRPAPRRSVAEGADRPGVAVIRGFPGWRFARVGRGQLGDIVPQDVPHGGAQSWPRVSIRLKSAGRIDTMRRAATLQLEISSPYPPTTNMPAKAGTPRLKAWSLKLDPDYGGKYCLEYSPRVRLEENLPIGNKSPPRCN